MSTDEALRGVFVTTLGLSPERADALEPDTPLFGAMPELDSMAVATLLTAMEDALGIIIDDDDVDAETFETYGSLLAFADRKRTAA